MFICRLSFFSQHFHLFIFFFFFLVCSSPINSSLNLFFFTYLWNEAIWIRSLAVHFQSVSPGSSAMSFSSISSSKIFTSFTKYQTPTSNKVPIITNAVEKKMIVMQINLFFKNFIITWLQIFVSRLSYILVTVLYKTLKTNLRILKKRQLKNLLQKL